MADGTTSSVPDLQSQPALTETIIDSDIVGSGIDTQSAPATVKTPDQAPHQAKPDMSIVRLIQKADKSADKLVNLLAQHFPSFRDEARFEGRKVRFYKRAQIFVADLWAAFDGKGYGDFGDIDGITMFAG